MKDNMFMRLCKSVSPRALWKLIFNFCFKGAVAFYRFKKRIREGRPFFPAFMMISLTSRCNYSCQGCWVGSDEEHDLPLPKVKAIVEECRKKGSYFFGLMGGEPLLYPGLMEIVRSFPDCYFQVFTNGTLLDERTAAELGRVGNVSPVISIEGLERASEIRRGSNRAYENAVNAVKNSVKAKLFTGVATSICRNNFDELVDRSFITKLLDMGVHYVWYYIYRPVGPRPCRELILEEQQILELRQFLVDIRVEFPLIVIDTYWDGLGRAVCPGAAGLSHHINPEGYIEFCPPIQFAKEKIESGHDLSDKIAGSDLLGSLREKIPIATRGCVFMDEPKKLCEWLKDAGAFDTSGRGSAYREFCEMSPCASHHIPGKEIPERSFFYRAAKKYWFFGFGAYG